MGPERRALRVLPQPRAPLGRNVIEIPAGLVGDHEVHTGENDETAARRELPEETGHTAAHWALLSHGPTTPGLSDEVMSLFLATGLHRQGPVVGDGHGQITLHEVPLRALHAWLGERERAGCLVDIKIFSGLYLAARHSPDLLGALYGPQAHRSAQ